MSNLVFETVAERPTFTRTAAENEFTPAIKQLAPNGKPSDSTLAFTVKGIAPDDAKVKAVVRQIRNAAVREGVTARIVPEAKGKDTRIVFWTVEKVTRPRKDKSADTAAK